MSRSQAAQARTRDWVQIRRDTETGIECVHAQFHGHAYDAHDHDEMLVGVTSHGVQQFNCRRSLHTSTAGCSILIEPGEVHDGHAPQGGSFTYAMLYLPQAWVLESLQRLGNSSLSHVQPAFRQAVANDVQLATAVVSAFAPIHQGEGRLARDQGLDLLMEALTRHMSPRDQSRRSDSLFQMERARSYLHDQMGRDIGLEELAIESGVDRFRLTRQFKRVFGQSPHAYLVRLRLRKARLLLASGLDPAEVASDVGFADQSHMGRWFQRAYRLTPAAYQKQCTNVLD